MSDSLYVMSMESRAGKPVVALGILDVLARRLSRIAVFRPIVDGEHEQDPLIQLLCERYQLDMDYADTHAFTYAEAADLENTAGTRRLVAEVVERANRLRDKYEFVLCVGTDYTGPSSATEFTLNAELAANLGSPVLDVVSGHGKDVESIVAAARHSHDLLVDQGCAVVATVVNRVDPAVIERVLGHGAISSLPTPVYVLPDLPVLAALTFEEVVAELRADVLIGDEAALGREVDAYLAGSGYIQTMLPRLKNGTLLVVSGDRADLVVGIATAATTPSLPTPGGVVLTCGIRLDALTTSLLESSGVPVAAVEMDTFTALHQLEGARGEIRPGSTRKIAAALGAFASSVDGDELTSRIRLTRTGAVTPLMFSSGLLQRARADRRRIVLPEAEDERVLRACEELVHQNVVDLVLLGEPDVVRARIAKLGLELPGIEIVDPATSQWRREFADEYARLRAHKHVTPDGAWDLMADGSYFGTMLVHTGRVAGMVSGATHTTAHTIRPALEVIKTEPGTSLVSSAFFMCLPQKVLVFADCAVNPDPTSEQLADIAICTADTAAAFGIEPRVALVSYSTGTSGTGADVDKVRAARDLVAARRPDLPLAGPIQYDAAVEPSVGAAKLPGNPVAGNATVLIFPDLNTGNTTYKAVQRSANAIAIGPVLQGLRRPVNDLSRGCTVPDIVNTVAITAIQAQQLTLHNT